MTIFNCVREYGYTHNIGFNLSKLILNQAALFFFNLERKTVPMAHPRWIKGIVYNKKKIVSHHLSHGFLSGELENRVDDNCGQQMKQQRKYIVSEFASDNVDTGNPETVVKGNRIHKANSHLGYLGQAKALNVRARAIVNVDARILGDPAGIFFFLCRDRNIRAQPSYKLGA